jgi:hypothetical protein
MLAAMMSDDDALLLANEAFYTAFAEGDEATMDTLWSETRPVACVHPGWAPLIGREAVMDSWRAILSNPPPIRSGRATPFVYGDTGFVLCHEVLQEAVLAATNIFVKEDGRWLLVHHQAGPVQQIEPEPESDPGPSRQLH